MSFSSIHFLCLPCWTYLASLSPGPHKTRDFHPLASSLHGWSVSFQVVQASLETQLPLPPAFLCVFSKLLVFAALSDISVLHLHVLDVVFKQLHHWVHQTEQLSHMWHSKFFMCGQDSPFFFFFTMPLGWFMFHLWAIAHKSLYCYAAKRTKL